MAKDRTTEKNNLGTSYSSEYAIHSENLDSGIVEINFNRSDSQPLIVTVGLVGYDNILFHSLVDNGAMVSLISDSEIKSLKNVELLVSDITGLVV